MAQFQPGQPRPANAGRKKGTPNKARAQDAVKTAFAQLALRRMQALDDALGTVIESRSSYSRMDVAKLLLRMMTVATRHADLHQADNPIPPELPGPPVPDTPAPVGSLENLAPPTAQQQMDAILFSNKLKGDAYVQEAIRLTRLMNEEKQAAAQQPTDNANVQASRSSDDPTTPI